MLGTRVQGLCVQDTGVQNIRVQDLGCQKSSPHPDTIHGPPEAPMEKDIDSCRNGAKTVPSAGMGTEGTETQVRPGEHPRGGNQAHGGHAQGLTAGITRSWMILWVLTLTTMRKRRSRSTFAASASVSSRMWWQPAWQAPSLTASTWVWDLPGTPKTWGVQGMG